MEKDDQIHSKAFPVIPVGGQMDCHVLPNVCRCLMCRCPVQGPQAAPRAQRQWLYLTDRQLLGATHCPPSLPLTKIQWSRCNYYKQFYRQANRVTSGFLVSCSRKWKTESQTAWPRAFLNQEAVGEPCLPCWGSHENVPNEWCRKSEEEGKTGPFGGCLSQGTRPQMTHRRAWTLHWGLWRATESFQQGQDCS